MPARYLYLLAVLPLGFVSMALADDSQCDAWTAEIWEVEGGTAMTAHICAKSGGERQPMLYLHCGQLGMLSLNYNDGGSGAPPGGNDEYKGVFGFAAGVIQIEAELSYQAMDGVLTADIPKDGPFAALLKSGKAITVTSPVKDFGSATFSLAGAPQALATLQSTCVKP